MMKKKVGIIFGGKSTEYEISLQSASAVIAGINGEEYEKVLIGIDREGRWYRYYGELENIDKDLW